jgi:hypothetical protein
MITDRPRPLPDCALCGMPTKRRVHRANAGMCTDCRREYDQRAPEQQTLPLLMDAPAPRPRDLTNVVVLDTRRSRTR